MQRSQAKRKERIGVVVSDAMDKTITVSVKWLSKHPGVSKTMKNYSKFKAHDEKEEAKVGDLVRIVETRPLSKTKRWRLAGVLTKR